MSVNDRAVGTLLGVAAGDALGAGYEFKTPGPTEPRMEGGGAFAWEPGEWTDDTQTTICVAEVTAKGSVDLDEIGDRLLAWYRSGPKDLGVSTRAVLGVAGGPEDLAAAAADFFARNPDGAAGNGSLMRTAPIALAHLGDDEAMAEAAFAVSDLTHGDPLAGDGCVLWCIAIDRAIHEDRLDGVRDGLEFIDPSRRDRWRKWLDEAEANHAWTFTRNGFVVRALQAAYSAIRHTRIPQDMPGRHLRLALENAVRIGDDTGTVAAIAGALLGARWGASAVPLEWREILHGWPGYRERDLMRLALQTAWRKASDSSGWPTSDSMFEYYESFHAPALAAPLDDDPGVVVGNVRGLVELSPEADVILSICRMGSKDAGDREHHELWLIDANDPAENPNLDLILRDAAEAIGRWRRAGKKVFVHCVAAESRTPTIAAAYLAEAKNLDANEALRRVKVAVPSGRPQPVFVEALRRLWPTR